MENNYKHHNEFKLLTGRSCGSLFYKTRDIMNYNKIVKYVNNLVFRLRTDSGLILKLGDEFIDITKVERLESHCIVEDGTVGLRVDNTTYLMFDPDFEDDYFVVSDDTVQFVRSNLIVYQRID